MEKWKEFELECVEYLNQSYGSHFTHLGFSDSTVSDIKYEKNKKSFFIEAKMPSAQSGQFVLLPDFENEIFIFSDKNKSEADETVELIIEYMNSEFDRYSSAGTGGENIDLPKRVFNDWIVREYRNKKVKYFITKGESFIIFPIEKYGDYFSVDCKFRVKKSGSSSVPKSRQSEVLEIIDTLGFKYEIVDDFLIKTDSDIENKSFSVAGNDYLIKRYQNDLFRVRKLSNTRNANVIFRINLIQEQNPKDLEEFKAEII